MGTRSPRRRAPSPPRALPARPPSSFATLQQRRGARAHVGSRWRRPRAAGPRAARRAAPGRQLGAQQRILAVDGRERDTAPPARAGRATPRSAASRAAAAAAPARARYDAPRLPAVSICQSRLTVVSQGDTAPMGLTLICGEIPSVGLGRIAAVSFAAARPPRARARRRARGGSRARQASGGRDPSAAAATRRVRRWPGTDARKARRPDRRASGPERRGAASAERSRRDCAWHPAPR